MTPADIAAAELRAGLSRRLAELGLVPPDPAVIRLTAVPAAARSRGERAQGRVSTVAALQGGASVRPALRPAAVLAVASASSFLVYLDATIVNVAFPDVRASFEGATLSGLSWILSAYGIVFAALLVPGGRLADVVGGRRLFLAGLAGFTLGSLAVRARAVGGAARRGARAPGRGRRAARPAAQLLVMAALPARAAHEGASARWPPSPRSRPPSGRCWAGSPSRLGGWRLVFLVNLPIGIAALAAGRRLPSPPTGRTARLPGPPRLACSPWPPSARSRWARCRGRSGAGTTRA